MNASTKRAACVLCAAAMFGCSQSDTLPAAVTGAWEQAFTRHDLAACVALFSDDAQILPQHGPQSAAARQSRPFSRTA